EAARPRCRDRQRIVFDGSSAAAPRHPQPIVVKTHSCERNTERAKRMHVALSGPAEVAKLDAELIGRIGGAHEFGLVEANTRDESTHVGDRRFTDTNGADFGRFDQTDGYDRAEEPRDRRGGHPTGSTAADDYHFHARNAERSSDIRRPRLLMGPGGNWLQGACSAKFLSPVTHFRVPFPPRSEVEAREQREASIVHVPPARNQPDFVVLILDHGGRLG